MNYKIKTSVLGFLSVLAFVLLQSCGIYNFTGTGSIDAKTFQVSYFQNVASIVEPGLDRTFTTALQDYIQNQTSLSLTNSNGDLLYEGEIIEYRISPMTATANQTAAQNRLYIAVKVRFTNKNEPSSDFEKTFSHFYDYPANAQLRGDLLNTAVDNIFERITQEIFNASLAKW